MTMRPNALAVAAIAALAPAALADISYLGGTYTQNFDGLGNTPSTTTTLIGRGPHAMNGVIGSTGVDGWYGANFAGSSANTEVRAQDGSLGSSGGRGVISYGTSASAERALGALPTSNQVNSIGAVLVNDSGLTLTSVTISFIGEQWRRGNVAAPNTLSFGWALSNSIEFATSPVAALDFISPNTQATPTEVALDGNSPLNQVARGATIDTIVWAPGAALAIRWTINDQSGQDDGLAIDTFTFSATPAPSSLALLGLGSLVAGRRRR